jgi:hypothetical protein
VVVSFERPYSPADERLLPSSSRSRPRALLRVQFTTQGRDVVDYAVVLLLETEKGTETIRVYDGAHDHNEMHRYTAAQASSRGLPFIAVPWEKECAPRSPRSSAGTAR